MRVSFAALLATCLCLPAMAADEGAVHPGWLSYAIPAPKAAAQSAQDPFSAASQVERAPLMKLKPGVTCGASELEVCLDSTGRIIVPGARRFLPELPGLKPERLTVKRSGVVLGYSF